MAKEQSFKGQSTAKQQPINDQSLHGRHFLHPASDILRLCFSSLTFSHAVQRTPALSSTVSHITAVAVCHGLILSYTVIGTGSHTSSWAHHRRAVGAASNMFRNLTLLLLSYTASTVLKCPKMSLAQAAQRTPAVGHIIGALWELRDLAAVAHGNRSNCDVMDAFGADVLRSLDFHGAVSSFPYASFTSSLQGLYLTPLVESYPPLWR